MKPVIRTFSGLYVNPLNLAQKDVRVEDIAHALANCNRFAGHLKKPISVAQHSVYVSRLCEPYGPHVAYQALFHDASEAYLGDVTKWLKQTPAMRGYRQAEERAQRTIYTALGITIVQHPAVGCADTLMVRYEGSRGFAKDWAPAGVPSAKYPPLTPEEEAQVGAWGFWSWREARQGFLDQQARLIRQLDGVLTDSSRPLPSRTLSWAAKRIVRKFNDALMGEYTR
jgi:hypothetical protein